MNKTEEFIRKAKLKHGDTYDYSKVDYVKTHQKVIIICKKHGEFEQTPHSHHYHNSGCRFCAGKYKSNTQEFIAKATTIHGDGYDYSKVNYTTSSNRVIVVCKIHGEFEQSPNSHLRGRGCNDCGNDRSAKIRRSNTEEFIEKSMIIYGDTYDYSKVEYITSLEKVIIICKQHGEFLQVAAYHLSGNGCPLCVNKTEGKLYEILKTIYPTITTQFKQEWCKNIAHLPFDFCIPEHNIIIELDGAQHFRQVRNWSSPDEQFKNDKFKEQCANDNNYSVIRLLQEDVWDDKYDWCKELCDAIEEIKHGDDVVNIYLCKNGEYDDF